MSQKVVRVMAGTGDQSVRCIVSLLFDDERATETDVIEVMSEVTVHAVSRYKNGPHEDGIDG